MVVGNKKADLLSFLIEQREQIKKQIEYRDYDNDLDELIILWKLYEIASKGIRDL